MAELDNLLTGIRACRVCVGWIPDESRPIVQGAAGARILVIGQAPGSLANASGVPWDDPSGDRLREWTGLSRDSFYNPDQVAHMPMAFCYPGKGASGDMPPRRECAPLWHARMRALLPNIRLTLLVGGYAQRYYLPRALTKSLTEAVRRHDEAGDGVFPLPHPSWRSRIWMTRNPWFETEILPVLREQVQSALQAPL